MISSESVVVKCLLDLQRSIEDVQAAAMSFSIDLEVDPDGDAAPFAVKRHRLTKKHSGKQR